MDNWKMLNSNEPNTESQISIFVNSISSIFEIFNFNVKF